MSAIDKGRSRASVRRWARLASAYESDLEDLADGIVKRVVTELPSFEAMPPGDMLAIANEGMSALIPALREQRPLAGREFELYRGMIEAQAVQGVLLDDMLQSWKVGFDALRTWGRVQSPADSDVLLDFLDIVIPWMDGGIATSVDWYRSAASRSFLADERERAAFVRRVLMGGLEASELQTRSRLFGLAIGSCYHALRAPAGDEGTLHRITTWLGLADAPGGRCGMLAAVDGEIWGFVDALPDESIDFPVGVSEAASLSELYVAFRFATRAMDTAAALGLTGRHDVRTLGVHVAVVEDHAIGASLLARYVAPLEALGQAGVEILNTVRAFLDNQGQYERTGAQLFVHPNTVRYRIKRYEEIVGTSIRDTATMVGIWWALERRRLAARGA